MCIIAYKPDNCPMPNKSILKTCFNNNPDGAGFMFIQKNKVVIEKGFMEFADFYKALKEHKELWQTSPFVLHFRISTQAGVNPECTHPFPLSTNMSTLKKLLYKTNIGIAHNGIISLTSNYYDKTITHSDTMEFITKYLSLIIKNNHYYRNADTLTLIEQLADSKLAILDNSGHCELIGDFDESNGVFYSNSSYKTTYQKYSYVSTSPAYNWDYYDEYDYPGRSYDTPMDVKELIAEHVKECYDYMTDTYYFDDWCPADLDNNYKYCDKCWQKHKCFPKSIDDCDNW